MPLFPTTLSAAEIKSFHDDGYVVVPGAFGREDAQAMQDEWWSELAEVHGVRREDRSTWRQIRGDLKRAKQSPLQHAIASAKARGVIDDLLGAGHWRPPRDWGRAIVTFPEPGAWDVPTRLWHWDSPWDWHREGLNGLFVVAFVGPVATGGGGTLILSGSPRLLMEQDARLTPEAREGPAGDRMKLFFRTDPWLMALAGLATSPPDRTQAFMEIGTEIEGVPLRVVELTGEPGDMVFCHPAIMHCGAANHGARPRMMRIKSVVTHEGHRLLGGGAPPAPASAPGA